jgi:hypothetical protein
MFMEWKAQSPVQQVDIRVTAGKGKLTARMILVIGGDPREIPSNSRRLCPIIQQADPQ